MLNPGLHQVNARNLLVLIFEVNPYHDEAVFFFFFYFKYLRAKLYFFSLFLGIFSYFEY